MKPRFPLWVYGIAEIAVMAGLVFLASGRLDYWQGWVFICINAAIVVMTPGLMRKDPGLAAERLHPGKGTKWWDKIYWMLSTPLALAAIVVACIDAGRTHWSRPPAAVPYLACLAVYLAGQGLFLWAKRANPFFSSVARIQTERGQSVCQEGPYRFVRHPGYLGGLLFGLASPFVLGSYVALIPQAVVSLLLVVRTGLEDRMLRKELLWYTEYTKAVRFRLIPGVW
jgi:protein-S-isoprenylcysteine O-methyltransferase Ste14